MQIIKCESYCDYPLQRYSPLKISLFEPSSSAKIVLHRGYQHSDILKVPVGKHEGKVVDLLENGE